MSEPRKCIYTDMVANTRDSVLPKECDQNLLHNWANRAPAHSDYLKTKQNRLPSELEMEANRLFHLLELARLDVVFFEAKLKEIQDALAGVKQEQIEKAYHVKDLDESLNANAEEIIKKVETKTDNKKKIWD